MTTKHTPGPWHVDQWHRDDNFAIRQHPSGTIAETPGWIAEHKDEERANALLIAAAPKLLDAGKQALRIMALHGIQWDAFQALFDACKEATGEQA